MNPLIKIQTKSAPNSIEQNQKWASFFVSVRYNDTMLQRMTQPQFGKQLLKMGQCDWFHCTFWIPLWGDGLK